ncbi:SDR family oxidoreductase [Mesobacillus subterraneus]|uniref:SDR family oxidoreductase n=1 Tax=Mesobacillus subterraneus TaxID=285983 RepID=UPI00203C3721|nr:SDR family oxidoreductase [Mesobacillus subterraneus]MCM3663172.1 SDR family oxidoreductase [Mesobacillus subterraneus]MCM3682654.1 SDR family oxidoreductase [Mesobacillus subterraneus]
MEYGYFFTGFPGFISNQLIREVLRKNNGEGTVNVLVLPSMTEKANFERMAIIRDFGISEDQFRIIEGDITQPGLEIHPEKNELLKERVTHVFHLAAIYDLAVPKDIAFRVNVDGTRNVNDWVRTLKNIQRFTYFSTGFVAGKREGILYEDELIRPPAFKNFYEETKYEAEVLVDSLKAEVPVTIIRPGIVKGHSKTGETIKFDGPYFIMNFIDRLSFMPFLPRLGKGDTVVNLVPVDYIIEATTYLTFADKGAGKTYHLTDPKPYKVSELYEMMMAELLQKQPKGSVPLSLAKAGLNFRVLRRYLGVEKEALDYFTWRGNFDSSQAQDDLKGSGIQCPDFKEGISAMASFYQQNKHEPNYQINIL